MNQEWQILKERDWEKENIIKDVRSRPDPIPIDGKTLKVQAERLVLILNKFNLFYSDV